MTAGLLLWPVGFEVRGVDPDVKIGVQDLFCTLCEKSRKEGQKEDIRAVGPAGLAAAVAVGVWGLGRLNVNLDDKGTLMSRVVQSMSYTLRGWPRKEGGKEEIRAGRQADT